jgi:glutathionyl-hydroquinone reductase
MLTETERQQIISNDYADIIIDINRDPQISELFPRGRYIL